ncbi:MAG: Crp/Fnr family transcriptional regulator [bacterium]
MGNELLLRKFQKQYQPGQVLFEEGDEGNHFFIIREGSITISKKAEGEKINIATVESGEILGEMALLGDTSARSATATAKTAVTCLKFPKKQLDQLMEENEEFRRRIVKLLCQRIADTTQKLSAYQKRDFIFHKAALLLLYQIDENDWYDETTQVKLTPDENKALKLLDLSPGDLDKFLSVKSKKKLSRVTPEEKKELLKITMQALERELENIEIE